MPTQKTKKNETISGSLRGTTTISIEFSTKAILRVWSGRAGKEGKGMILSAPSFFKKIKTIHHSIVKDDPYGDYYFYKIEKAIEEKVIIMKDKIQQIEGYSDEKTPPGMIVKEADVFGSYGVRTLHVYSKLSFKYAHLLLLADEYMKNILILNHINIIDSQLKKEISLDIQKSLRSIIYLSVPYVQTGVTRDDMSINNDLAKLAITKMGPLEDDFLNGTLRASSAPDISSNVLKSIKKGLSEIEDTTIPDGSIKQRKVEKLLRSLLPDTFFSK